MPFHAARGIVLLLLLYVTGVNTAVAYDSSRLREAAGAYIRMVDFVNQFERSQCGFVRTRKRGLAGSEQAVYKALNHRDGKEFKKFLHSDIFRKNQAVNRQMLNTAIDDGIKTHDLNTVCETLSTRIEQLYKKKLKRWRAAVKRFGR